MKKIIVLVTLILLSFVNSLCFSQGKVKDAESYFMSFSNSDLDTYTLFVLHQPSLRDCQKLFKEDMALWLFRSIVIDYCDLVEEYSRETGEASGNIFMDYKAVRVNSFSTSDVINGTCDVCPGKINNIASYLNPDITCYVVKFLQAEEDDAGMSYTFFCYLDGRWVFFPIK